jgi:adenosylcobyric acid synthase
MSKAIMFLGTGSDVGKSVAATAFCRIFKRRGFRVAPFKAQNMSNNSFVTMEGGEIGRAQAVQAEAAGIMPSVDMNPVLIKPSSECGSQIVLQGRVFGMMKAADYQDFKPRLKKTVMESYSRLEKDFDLIVLEGAGSCCEMNLKENDLVNFAMAEAVNASCILIADIDRGGVFAQVIGTYNLMSGKERRLVTGFLINKFRGDPRLFRSGIEYIEKETGKHVLGLIPWFHDIYIDQEDSVAIQEDRKTRRPLEPDSINIAVLRLPCISNFTDMDILAREHDVILNYLSRPEDLSEGYDCLIIPGTKNVMEDAGWIARNEWKSAIKRLAEQGQILGICGGYQLMGRRIMDPYGMESSKRLMKGLGLLPVETVLERKKTVRKVSGFCKLNRCLVTGYEIHMGCTAVIGREGEAYLQIKGNDRNETWQDGCSIEKGRLAGTYVHGIFDNSSFRAGFLNALRRMKGLKERRPGRGISPRTLQYNRLAEHFERHCDVERIVASL